MLYVRDRLANGSLPSQDWNFLDPTKKLLLVTAHRRESFGEGFERICTAISQVAELDDVQVVYPVHPNPNVSGPVRQRLSGRSNIHLIDPLDYVAFVDMMRRSYLLLTDSGGVQEEAPSLGKPVLVMREKTERPEAVEAGTSTLVGTDFENCGYDRVACSRYRRIRAPVANPQSLWRRTHERTNRGYSYDDVQPRADRCRCMSTDAIRVLALMESTNVSGPAKNIIEFARRARTSENGRRPVQLSLITYVRDADDSEFVVAAREAGITTFPIRERRAFDTSAIASSKISS